MIRLSNGHLFDFMTASGALGFNGKGWAWEQPWRWVDLLDPVLFTSVTKTLTRYPTEGNHRWYNPFRSVRLLRDGVANAMGLPNPGIDWWCQKIGPSLNSARIPLVVSIFGETEELAEMAAMLSDFDVIGIEINASCPNKETVHDTERVIASCQAVKSSCPDLPLILKLSVTHDVPGFVKEIESLVEAISINSVPWRIAFPYCRSPLEFIGGGGVSGKAAQPFTWKMVQEVAETTRIPVIAPSMWDFDDIRKVTELGAKAVSFGSVFLRYPWRPTQYVRRFQQV